MVWFFGCGPRGNGARGTVIRAGGVCVHRNKNPAIVACALSNCSGLCEEWRTLTRPSFDTQIRFRSRGISKSISPTWEATVFGKLPLLEFGNHTAAATAE